MSRPPPADAPINEHGQGPMPSLEKQSCQNDDMAACIAVQKKPLNAAVGFGRQVALTTIAQLTRLPVQSAIRSLRNSPPSAFCTVACPTQQTRTRRG